MSSARDKLLRRCPKAIDIDGESIHVRSMTLAEVLEVESMEKAGRAQSDIASYVVSRCVVESDGHAVFDRPDDPDLLNITTDKLAKITDAVGKLSRAGSAATLEKNSAATR